jgi:hypothetical protein
VYAVVLTFWKLLLAMRDSNDGNCRVETAVAVGPVSQPVNKLTVNAARNAATALRGRLVLLNLDRRSY